MRVRQPLRTLEPDKANEYLQRIAPAVGGLAARASSGGGAGAVFQWENPHGHRIVVRASNGMSEADRVSVREAIERVLGAWAANSTSGSSAIDHPPR